MALDLRLVRSFIAVTQAGTITRAAERLRLSQRARWALAVAG